MPRETLSAVHRHLVQLKNAIAAPSEFVRQHLWRWLAWPIVAIIAAALGWHFLFLQLDAERKAVESEAMRDAETLANGYAEQVSRAVDTVEQSARYVKYQWEVTGGHLHLGYADEQGLFVHSSRLRVYVVDSRGNVLTSTAPSVLSSHAVASALAQVRNAMPVYFLPDEIRIEGNPSVKHRLLFAWELTDQDGRFSAAVIVATDPAYFTAGYSDAVYRHDGLLAIVGDDGRTRALRMESNDATVRWPEFMHVPSLPMASGTMLAAGKQWFDDQRDRIIGWRHVDRRGVSVIVGYGHETVLESYHEMREAWIRSAFVATLALALATLLALANAVRLARKSHELNLIRATYRTATEASNEGFYMLWPRRSERGAIEDFEVTDCNRRGAELVGREKRDLIGKTLSDVYGGDAFQERLNILLRAMEAGYHEADLTRPSDDFPAKWVHLKLVRHGGNLAVSVRDISEERQHAEELLRRSNEDALTHLPNRYWVENYLPTAVARAEHTNGELALLFIDLDGFKAINDTWGHAAGDEALCLAAKRLKDTVRPHDCVTRFGGDEFLVVLVNIPDRHEAARVSERILHAFHRTFRLSCGDYVIGVSIGISVFPADGKDARILLQNADVAMYSVKTTGKGDYRFFDRKFYEELKVRMERMRELRHALDHDEFVVHYQPRARVVDGTVSSFEALVRWMHPKKGMIAPAEFMPLVEESGLVLQLGELVIDKVCAQLALWAQRSAALAPVSVNISPRQFNDTDVAKTLAVALERHRVPAGLIEVELTESSVMNDSERALGALHAIRRMGIKVLVDDFGTGYSSLSQLYKLKFDGLKIDRAFVLQLGNTEGGTVIVKAIITMARALGMHVVAEGVETMEQVAVLRSLGCDEIQGYLVSEPQAPADTQPVSNNIRLVDDSAGRTSTSSSVSAY